MIDLEFEFRYANEKNAALQSVRMEIPKGRCIVLCGGSGCGKSTLLRCINGLIPQFYEGELTGFCRLNGQDTADMSIGEIGELAASVFQDPRSQFFTVNSSSEVAFGLENHGMAQSEIQRRVDAAFATFHLEYLKNHNVYELSSGEKQLVSILAAWAMDTDIFLLDEPTANLDFAAIKQLRTILLALKEQGKTLLFSEHRLYYLAGLADEYWVMRDGQITAGYTLEQLTALPDDTVLPLRALNLNGLRVAQGKGIPTAGELLLSISNLHFSYGRRAAETLAGAALSVREHEVVGLIGANGCGKTTLGKLIAGLYAPVGGEIRIGERRMKPKELQKQALFIMQEAEFQFFTNSVLNELKYGHTASPEFEEKVEQLLKRTGMWEFRNRHPFSLSGGQMQKLALMMAFLSEKPLVILDEPTAGLDAQSLDDCAALIRDMQCEKTVLIITHDLEMIARVCTRCICLAKGNVEAEFPVRSDSDLQSIHRHMREAYGVIEKRAPTPPQISRLHPTVKLLFALATMIAISTSNNALVFAVYAALLVMTAFDGSPLHALGGGAIVAALWGANALFPHTALTFALMLFPRVIAVGIAARTMIGKNEASRMLTALRNMHLPERFIMICAVIFRFFPVLASDMKLLRQSICTRGVFSTFAQKLRALPEYVEILTVPMAMRVIRIAETLSASAETRGIDLKRRKSNYLSLRFSAWDAVFLLLLTAAALAGILL